ncbi:BTAD domain-containing putative transcriptional regulator [Nocardiopsis sp. RSe5-2]|uniref:BTAD domain-containing putative transcriptional regulator n=1 Tax=Nocardiopsis endophytica TaxID=3018445 RepID=A0ABT4U5H9_9ACTN|nr:BTAD domain-containing putative transcriptional regulator [Nocardiopsis endophytica]MDA2812204.1 BTAD domain-containing putative transcriptional regulator [Nocardiopsis endophytica]
MERVGFGVLGPVAAERDGAAVPLKGPRHRAVLALLLIARRRVVPVDRLVDALWEDPPDGAVGAVRTFVAALRRALEPDRPPRTPPRLLVTEGPGYALRAAPGTVDAWRFEDALHEAADRPPKRALELLDGALWLWRGPAYADFADEHWAQAERARLNELRLQAVERRADSLLALGEAADAVPDLDAQAADHPWREERWRLLALALYRSGRQGDALAVLRRARSALADALGVDPGPRLRRLEADVLAQDPALDRPEAARSAAEVWARTAAVYDRSVAAGSRARLESSVGLLRSLAVTGGGGLEAARENRLAAVRAAEEADDPELAARVIGAYDVPAIWPRSDDPAQAREIVAAAERALAALPSDGGEHAAARCRLLATIGLEMRGVRSPRGPQAAREAEAIARRLDDPALLAFALNAVFMQSCTRAGGAGRRDAIGAEATALGARHALPTYEVFGRMVRMQARAGLGDFAAADEHAAAVDRLSLQNELPLARVFTRWYRALRVAVSGRTDDAEKAYRDAAAELRGSGMPGVEEGLLPLALLCLHLSRAHPGAPSAVEEAPESPEAEGGGAPGSSVLAAVGCVSPDSDWGPYRPWVEPLLLLHAGKADEAGAALRALPEPAPDLLYEALCCLEAATALELGDHRTLVKVRNRLLPARKEIAGAGSGMVTVGPVEGWLKAIAAATGEG